MTIEAPKKLKFPEGQKGDFYVTPSVNQQTVFFGVRKTEDEIQPITKRFRERGLPLSRDALWNTQAVDVSDPEWKKKLRDMVESHGGEIEW